MYLPLQGFSTILVSVTRPSHWWVGTGDLTTDFLEAVNQENLVVCMPFMM